MVDKPKITVSTESATPISQENQLVEDVTPILLLKTTEKAVKTTEEAEKTTEETLKTTEEAVASIKTTAADLFRASYSPQRQRPLNRFVYHHFLSGL